MHVTVAMPGSASISYVMSGRGHYYSAAHRETVSEVEDRDYNVPVMHVDVIDNNETPINEKEMRRK